jgi:hypothetical protein
MPTSASEAENDGGVPAELELPLEGGASRGTGIPLDAGESVNAWLDGVKFRLSCPIDCCTVVKFGSKASGFDKSAKFMSKEKS